MVKRPSDKQSKRTSRLAIMSMICLVLGVICASLAGFFDIEEMLAKFSGILFLIAFVLGITARFIISLQKKYLKGYGYTVVPIVLGGILTLLYVAMPVYLAPVVQRRVEFEKTYTAKYNLRLLAKAIKGYAEDNNGYLPSADRWCDLLIEYDKSLTKDSFKHPKIDGAVIAFNKNLSGKKLEDLPDDIVLLFVAYGGWNLSGDKELFYQREIELNTREYSNEEIEKKPCFPDLLFLNGRIVYYWFGKGYRDHSQADFKPLRWKP